MNTTNTTTDNNTTDNTNNAYSYGQYRKLATAKKTVSVPYDVYKALFNKEPSISVKSDELIKAIRTHELRQPLNINATEKQRWMNDDKTTLSYWNYNENKWVHSELECKLDLKDAISEFRDYVANYDGLKKDDYAITVKLSRYFYDGDNTVMLDYIQYRYAIDYRDYECTDKENYTIPTALDNRVSLDDIRLQSLFMWHDIVRDAKKGEE